MVMIRRSLSMMPGAFADLAGISDDEFSPSSWRPQF
jgi:hypothetical protein